MKHLFILIAIFLFGSELISAQDSCRVPQSNTIFANLTAAQANDTIQAYSNNNKFVILDVRTPTEYASKHIKNGVNIDYYSNDFSAKLEALNRDKVYLLHCAGGSRSSNVFIWMQNINFRYVYNMSEGINDWVTKGFPTTTETSPVLGACNTAYSIQEVAVGKTDSVKLTITNSANDTLRFSGISDLSSTNFSTNFDKSTKLAGANDYSFYIYFTPTDETPDSVKFTVNSNGGEVDFMVHGFPASSTSVSKLHAGNISVINDMQGGRIIITNDNPLSTKYSLYNTDGKMIVSSNLSADKTISYSNLKNGIYLLRLFSADENRTYKLLLLHQ